MRAALSALVAVLAIGCTGYVENGPSGPLGGPRTPTTPTEPLTTPSELGPIALRRLTRDELGHVVRDLTGVDVRVELELLPEDPETPFDNDASLQIASGPLVLGIERIAETVAARVLDDPALRARVVGCEPSAIDDACMRTFVARFGRRALRRPLAPDEVETFAALPRTAGAQNVDQALSIVLRALLQDPELVYRVEIGEEVSPGVVRLSSNELAARLSFLLWGTTPDDDLLDRVDRGELDRPEGVRAVAEDMLRDPRAAQQVARFHAMWLGYRRLPHPAALASSLSRETEALLTRVVLDERRPWLDVFTSDETYVDRALAEHYEIDPPDGDGPAWVRYPEGSERAGILSHGTFLSAASKWGDTSPTQRGVLVQERLFCTHIPPPSPELLRMAGASVDEPPPDRGSPCKSARYAAHASGACAHCHLQVDPIGFGLERYDVAGRFREHDEGLTECTLDGRGELAGVGEFSGPGELGALVASSDRAERCAVQQVLRFALGEADPELGARTLDGLVSRFDREGGHLHTLLIELVASHAFRHRMVPADEEG
ncbi:DUF1592 domain-containing protein [Sandaracinus amylolyticus]|uniref:DUF1592 domain-containing protein n=1 Tax=Sandaracinus amylolyticus TaxID=927083 RepID=UPI001F427A57|nr:DUF1592 domain-containing protein [Sandaracinus amylolyticus]UJR84552.1 Hypothetical protein I5071_66310 [Sandaracinus amylolyticus]